jgi:beta-phosphoglucomutase-like phosphatase (HAD superfamily)
MTLDEVVGAAPTSTARPTCGDPRADTDPVLPARLDTVLVDLEGTLTDRALLHTEAWCRALDEAGVRVPGALVHRASCADPADVPALLFATYKQLDAGRQATTCGFGDRAAAWDEIRRSRARARGSVAVTT